MSLIPIDEGLQKSEETAEFLLFLMDTSRVKLPKLSLFEILKGKFRPGMSSEILVSSIVSRFEEAGIPSGPLANGAPNVMENYTKILSEEIINMIQKDMRVDVAVDPGLVSTVVVATPAGPGSGQAISPSPQTATGIAS